MKDHLLSACAAGRKPTQAGMPNAGEVKLRTVVEEGQKWRGRHVPSECT
jgi:hypothetical protein